MADYLQAIFTTAELQHVGARWEQRYRGHGNQTTRKMLKPHTKRNALVSAHSGFVEACALPAVAVHGTASGLGARTA